MPGQEMPSAVPALAKLAQLYALNQLSKSGGAFVPYPPRRPVSNQPSRTK